MFAKLKALLRKIAAGPAFTFRYLFGCRMGRWLTWMEAQIKKIVLISLAACIVFDLFVAWMVSG